MQRKRHKGEKIENRESVHTVAMETQDMSKSEIKSKELSFIASNSDDSQALIKAELEIFESLAPKNKKEVVIYKKNKLFCVTKQRFRVFKKQIQI